MNKNGLTITHQLKKINYSGCKSLIQQIQYKLISITTGKYANQSYINEFTDWLIVHIFRNSISTQSEKRFNQFNMPMLYFVFIIKTYLFPKFSINDMYNEEIANEIKPIFKSLLPSYENNYEEYYFDINRYLYLYDLIDNNKYIIF